MGLIIPRGPSWAYCSHNFPATPAVAAPGVACTPGVSNADGSAVDLFGGTPLSHDVEYLQLAFNYTGNASANNDILASILIDPAGGSSWATLIPYLICGASTVTLTSGSTLGGVFSCVYEFPLWIPAGATLGVQARTANGSAQTLYTSVIAQGGNENPGTWWCGQRVTGIGINAAASTGQAHTAGNSSAFSSWTNLGSGLVADCGALQWGVNGEGDAFYSGNLSYQFEFGVAGNRIGSPILKGISSSEVGSNSSTGLISKRLKAATQLQVRGTCSGTAQSLGVAAYAVH